MRSVSLVDELIGAVDQAVRVVFGPASVSGRLSPAAGVTGDEPGAHERIRTGRLMRVNHTGEVCAQALYQGQALAVRRISIRKKLEQAASEENDHLAWCQERIRDLGARTSYLNPVWYLSSFTLGALVGLTGDKWSLGFLAETERQVVIHLDKHLARLSLADRRSRAILEQMRADEAGHATAAFEMGAHELPDSLKTLMYLASKIMTRTAYWI